MNKRAYDNSNRVAQAEATKQRIIGAVATVLEGGLSELTMPAVAKTAGVSLPTVYRYFPDKAALLDAAADDARAQLGVRYQAPESFEELLDNVHRIFARSIEHAGAMRVLAAAADGTAYPPDKIAWRRSFVESGLRDALKGVRGKQRQRAIDAVMALHSSPMAIAFARFGIQGKEAADLAAWMTEQIVKGVTK